MNELVCVWADGTWCFTDELWEMGFMSDDYVTVPYDETIHI